MSGFNWEKTRKENRAFKLKRIKMVKPLPNHKCLTCSAGVYDKRPVCYNCFKQGKYPRSEWGKTVGKI